MIHLMASQSTIGVCCGWCMEKFAWLCLCLRDQRNGVQVRKVIWRLFDIWPTAEAAAGATDDTLVVVEKLIQPLGLFRKRTIAIKRFSQEYLEAEVRRVCITYSAIDCSTPYDANSCFVAEGSTCIHSSLDLLVTLCILCMAVNQSINMFNVLGGNWDPTDKKFSEFIQTTFASYAVSCCECKPMC